MDNRNSQLFALPGALEECRLCPRMCGANRACGGYGFCRAGSRVEVFSYGPHHGEEPPVSGVRGSGTVFFSRCTLSCMYCQNYRFSQQGEGEPYDSDGLVEILRRLHAKGCHNWNLVSPTPWLPFIVDAIQRLKNDGIYLPVVYNTSGFEAVGTLAGLEDVVSVYLTDLRYSKDGTAEDASCSRAYVKIARDALREMWRQKGALKLDAGGIAVSGTICRLLILPGHAGEAVDNLRWLAGNIGTDIAVSVMAQYTPAHRAVGINPWGRRITEAEYGLVSEAVEGLGFASGWVQDFSVGDGDGLAGFNLKQVKQSGAKKYERTQ